MCLLIGAGSFFYTNYRSTNDIGGNNHKFCQLMSALLSKPEPAPPADPETHPAQEKIYKDYIIIHNLAADLGCIE